MGLAGGGQQGVGMDWCGEVGVGGPQGRRGVGSRGDECRSGGVVPMVCWGAVSSRGCGGTVVCMRWWLRGAGALE